jgi:hypothetical protein
MRPAAAFATARPAFSARAVTALQGGGMRRLGMGGSVHLKYRSFAWELLPGQLEHLKSPIPIGIHPFDKPIS